MESALLGPSPGPSELGADDITKPLNPDSQPGLHTHLPKDLVPATSLRHCTQSVYEEDPGAQDKCYLMSH